MSLNDPLANAMSGILNSEKVAKKQVEIRPVSKLTIKVLEIMQNEGYIGSAEITVKEQKMGGRIVVSLLGKINNCGVVKPRFSVSAKGYEKFEKRFLPAKGVGILIVSTPKGIITNEEAREKKLGGKLLAYCY